MIYILNLIFRFPLRFICIFKGHKYEWKDKGGFFGFFESKNDYKCSLCFKETTQEYLNNSSKYKLK